jgi:dedicator of cytokinesis protein 3
LIPDIQICNVKPLPEDDKLFHGGMFPVPRNIAEFYQVNMVRKFQNDRPIHKGPVHKDNEFKVRSKFILYHFFNIG